ncbi:hypothetical protein GCK72_024237 [Caenorhabditis remanei]|uniref:Uncharacterized protein n=1 Tax=Caenorhabditis remanei TaxID=31234 RepID=A0A6A5FZ78_CAERE|nr:hypothetical protein GCK72_024237 [Caenorhabditis remanei]KAF1747771.1 hypothetical protein GCK72_024237 [Caenorhabditis remanei]
MNLRRDEGFHFFLDTIFYVFEHCRFSRKHDVGVQVSADIDVARLDGVDAGLMDSKDCFDRKYLEESLWAAETLISDGDELTIRKLSDVAELLLDVTDDFTFGGGCERVTTLGENLHEVVGEITSSKIETTDSVWEGVSFVNRNGVGDTISGVKNDSGDTSRSVEGEDSLDGDVHGWSIEAFKHDLSHAFRVGLRVEWSFSEENCMVFWSNTELIVEGVVPDLLHVIPVGDDSVLDRILESQDASLRLVSNVRILMDRDEFEFGQALKNVWFQVWLDYISLPNAAEQEDHSVQALHCPCSAQTLQPLGFA